MNQHVSNVNTEAGLYLPVMNLRQSGVTNARTDTLEGRTHYVLPVTMLVVGIHNGSQGPIKYTADELKASARLWNGKPVVVYHPQLNGQGVSAADPEITSRYRIGAVYNTRFDGKRLTAELWIDAERVEQVDGRVADAVRLNQMMEVSTGLYSTPDGEIARNIQPDHLAILPDQIGACSIADGCGMARNASPLVANATTNMEEEPMYDEDQLPMPVMNFGVEKPPTVNNGGGDRDDQLPMPVMNFGECGCDKHHNTDAATDDGLDLPSMYGHIA